jgi:hypothetical protein
MSSERILSFLVIDGSSLSVIDSIKREAIRPGHREAIPRRPVAEEVCSTQAHWSSLKQIFKKTYRNQNQ